MVPNSFLISSCKTDEQLIQGTVLVGWAQDFREGGSRMVKKKVPYTGIREPSPQKIFKIDIPGNGISGILTPSQRVTLSHFFFD